MIILLSLLPNLLLCLRVRVKVDVTTSLWLTTYSMWPASVLQVVFIFEFNVPKRDDAYRHTEKRVTVISYAGLLQFKPLDISRFMWSNAA